jgi:hypothetical protein
MDPGAIEITTGTPEAAGAAQLTPHPARVPDQQSSGGAGHLADEDSKDVENESSAQTEWATATS